MKSAAKLRVMPAPVKDPAGLDQLLLAAGKGVARYVEGLAARHGVNVNLWDGNDGLGAVLAESFENAGVPNQRFADLVSPRSIAQRAGIIRKPSRRRVK